MRHHRSATLAFGATLVAVLFATSFGTSSTLKPVSITSADLNGDGRADVIVGYTDGNAGLLAIRTRATDPAPAEPFSPEVARLSVPETPDFLAAGDYDLDGRQDLLVAALRSSVLWIYHGDGRGGFDAGRRIELSGRLTALAAGEVNRVDGIDDVVAAVETGDGAKLLVFEFHRGAFAAAPESINMKAPASSLALGRFDDDIFVDVAAAIGREIRLVHGRDRKTSLPGRETVVTELEVEDVTLDDLAVRTDDDVVRSESFDGLGLRLRLGSSALRDLVVPSVQFGEVSVARAPSALTFVVDTTGDAVDAVPGNGVCADAGGLCSLRAAIQEANASAGADTIVFNLGSGTPTISPTSQLPTISETVTIDGATGGATRVELSGTGAGTNATGLLVGGAGSVAIRNMVVNRFTTAGIWLTSANNVVEGCYLGTDADGGSTIGGNLRGVQVSFSSAANNTIGGTTAAQRNVISHNTSIGILVESSASGTKIQGNYIGTDASGAAANANGPTGIFLDNAPTTLIGGAAPAPGLPPGNLISGVVSVGPQSTGTLIQGNLFGTDATGGTAIPGGSSAGVSSSAANATIGGSAASLRNVIAGSVNFSFTAGGGSLVQGNYLGTEITGMSALTGGDVSITNGGSATVGGNAATPGAPPGNVLRIGVSITGGTGPSSGTLRGNLIGLRADGNAALAGATGVKLLGAGAGGAFASATIGGDTPGDGNVISGATGAGISLANAIATVKGNIIGLNIDGTAVIGNSGDGISVTSFTPGADLSTLTLGGTTPSARNVIGGNGGHGVSLARNVNGSLIAGNYIGLLANGTTAAGNGGHGVRASFVSGTITIGGTTGLTPGACTGSCNVIAKNAGDGVAMISDSGFGSVAIRGNSFFGNLGLGIDLNDNGPDTNDAGDADGGVNGNQNYPLVTSEIYDGVDTTILGTLNSTPSSTFNIEVFANLDRDPPGFAEGRTYVGSTVCSTNASGDCSWSVVYHGQSSLHTATSTTTTGKTSELTKNQDPNDVDGDGSPNGVDNCPNNYNPSQQDSDADGPGDACDNCAFVANANQANADGDGLGDLCDPCPMDAANDQDGDLRCGNVDNCPTTSNHAQADRDLDGRGDRCDNCPSFENFLQTDSDGDGAGDECDCEPSDGTDRVPAEILSLTAGKSGASGIALTWNANGTRSDRSSVTRGLLSAKGPGQYGSCLVDGIRPPTSYTDATVPPPGDGFFYLVQGQNFDCGMGSLGFTSSDDDRINSDPNACQGYPVNDAYASSETTSLGTVSGSYLDTHTSNDVVESLTEGHSGPARRLVNLWTFSVVAGAVIEFHLEYDYVESPENDRFQFAWSTDGDNWTNFDNPLFPQADLDTDILRTFNTGVSGTVFVRVMDTQLISGEFADTIHVDKMWIRSIP